MKPVYPLLTINLKKLVHNTKEMLRLTRARGIDIWGVTKVLGGAAPVGEAMLRAGLTTLADSRQSNLKKLPREATKVLLRLPDPRQAEQVVAHAHWSLNSELHTLRALSEAAVTQGVEHRVLIMVDLGDLREGVWPEDVVPFVREAACFPGLHIGGLGTNLTCYGGVLPEKANLTILTELAEELRQRGLSSCEVVSGGNSGSLPLLMAGELPKGINNLRLGESLILGRETAFGHPLEGFFQDVATLSAAVVEVKTKPSLPLGTIGRDAFGAVPQFVDRGRRRRAILALGRQDVRPEGLTPLAEGVEILGASSDHLLLDVTDYEGQVEVGQAFHFALDYGALLAATTSAYVAKDYLSDC